TISRTASSEKAQTIPLQLKTRRFCVRSFGIAIINKIGEFPKTSIGNSINLILISRHQPIYRCGLYRWPIPLLKRAQHLFEASAQTRGDGFPRFEIGVSRSNSVHHSWNVRRIDTT